MLDQLAYDMRVNVHLGVVQSINDSGQAQTATVTSHDGFPRADLQVMQPFGFASLPPGDGAIGMMFSIGGDAGQFVLLPLCCPSVRFGNLLNGESVMYAADGTRVHIRQGGVIDVIAATTVLVQVGAVTLTVSASGVAIVGHLTVTGDINATGNVSDGVGALSRLRGHYDGHTHTAPDGATSTTSEPD